MTGVGRIAKTLTWRAGPPTALATLLVLWAAAAGAQDAGGGITQAAGAPESGEAFGCRIPVSIHHPDSLPLEQFNVVAKAYRGGTELASTGIKTDGDVLVAHRRQEENRIVYDAVPIQFELTERDCEAMTGLGVVFARCTFEDGKTTDCLDRLRIEPQTAGGVRFFVGEDAAVLGNGSG